MRHPRMAASAMAISAAAFVGLITHEGWFERATVPVKGDVPTVGPGLTKRPDGTPVQMGDTIKPVEGVQRSYAHIAQSETRLKACVTGQVSQVEYDLLMDFAYQYGEAAACGSSMVRSINAGRYIEACQAYRDYRFMTSATQIPGWEPFRFDKGGKAIRWRYDCSTTTADGKRNKVCWGVWARQEERINKCMGAQ